MIKNITPNDLRRMSDRVGLVLQGCGGDPQKWLDGINGLLTEAGILLEGDTFKNVSAFEHDGHTNLLFDMEDVKLDGGKLAMWRLQSHSQFGGTWLSDYVPNRLGGFVSPETPQGKQLPDCPLIGQDGNVFNLIGIASRTLKQNGMSAEAKEMSERAFASGSYDEALGVIMEYVSVTSADNENEDFDEDHGMGGLL
jgi:hypothetical protein